MHAMVRQGMFTLSLCVYYDFYEDHLVLHLLKSSKLLKSNLGLYSQPLIFFIASNGLNELECLSLVSLSSAVFCNT